jgi:hypothetical protein
MKKIILLIAIIARLAADPNLPSQPVQSHGWFITGWACMDIWNKDNDQGNGSITDLKALFTNKVASAILDPSNNTADNVIIPPNFVIYDANRAVIENYPWPLVNFFFQYIYSINQVINTWISNNQTYLKNVTNACTNPITSTKFDCNLLPNLTLQDLYNVILNKIFNTYSGLYEQSSAGTIINGFSYIGSNLVDGTIRFNSSIDANITSYPAWTLFTGLLKSNFSQQVNDGGIEHGNYYYNTFGSISKADSTSYPNQIRIINTLGLIQCDTFGDISWSDNNSNNFATSGTWQNSPCTATNSPVSSSTISGFSTAGSYVQTFCLPKQPNISQLQNAWPPFRGCQLTTQL